MYDTEAFFDEMIAIFNSTNLNAKCTALNTEKGDDELKTDFSDADSFILNFNEKVMNEEIFVHYGFVDVDTPESVGGKVSEEMKMFFSIWMRCADDEVLEMRKLLRYTRALEEIARDNAFSSQASTLEIEKFAPVTIDDNTGSSWYRAAGIHVTGVVG